MLKLKLNEVGVTFSKPEELTMILRVTGRNPVCVSYELTETNMPRADTSATVRPGSSYELEQAGFLWAPDGDSEVEIEEHAPSPEPPEVETPETQDGEPIT